MPLTLCNVWCRYFESFFQNRVNLMRAGFVTSRIHQSDTKLVQKVFR